jgi:hypothetical protein
MADNGSDENMLANVFSLLLFETLLAKEAINRPILLGKTPRLFMMKHIGD